MLPIHESSPGVPPKQFAAANDFTTLHSVSEKTAAHIEFYTCLIMLANDFSAIHRERLAGHPCVADLQRREVFKRHDRQSWDACLPARNHNASLAMRDTWSVLPSRRAAYLMWAGDVVPGMSAASRR